MSRFLFVIIVVVALSILACGSGSQPAANPPADTNPEEDIPIVPLPTDRPTPSEAEPETGRWLLTSFEGDLTITVTPIGALCTDAVTQNPPLPERSYVELAPDGKFIFKFSWESVENEGFTYDYSDRDGNLSMWTWPTGVEGTTELGHLLVYGDFIDATHLSGRWELTSSEEFLDCRQDNSGTGTWTAQAP